MASGPAGVAKLADVARRAGVGNATVSRALNGGKNVSSDAMQRIEDAIRALNYTPNRLARSLKGASSGMIGMIVPSISDLFFSKCAEVVENVVRQHGGLLVVLASHDENELVMAGIRQLLLHRVDGLILALSTPHTRELSRVIKQLSIPVVGIDGPLANEDRPSVLCENYQGARMATEHLLGHGYRRVVSVQVKPDLYTMRERLRGYNDAMSEARLQPVQEVIASRSEAAAVLRRQIRRAKGTLAIFAGNNLSARYVCEAVYVERLSIPDEVAILSFDDFDLADTLKPPMSVVQQPLDDMGRMAATILFAEMNGTAAEDGHGAGQRMLSPRLVLRESCGCHGLQSHRAAAV